MKRIFWVMMLVVVVFSANAQQDVTDVLMQAVKDVPGLVDVVSVDVVSQEVDDEVILTAEVVYLTIELSELGYRAEIIEVMRALGNAIEAGEYQFDSVLLVPSITADMPVETVATDMDAVSELVVGEMSRTDFLMQLEVVSGMHQHVPPSTDEGGEI